MTERIGEEMARSLRVRQASLQLWAKAAVVRAQARARRMTHQMRGWIEAAGLGFGPLFRSLDRWSHVGGGLSDRGVAEVVKRRAALAGFDPAEFGGRSLGPARA